MPRIRTLKPEIWMSPQVMNLSFGARLLFIGMITQADDDGRGTADPRRLKAAIFGGDELAVTQVRTMLDEVSSVHLAVLYEAPEHGVLYELCSWHDHQKIDRAKKSVYPSPKSPSARRIGIEGSSSDSRGIVGDQILSEGSEGSQDRTGGRDARARDDSDEAESQRLIQATYPRGDNPSNWTVALHNAARLVSDGFATWGDLVNRVRAYATHFKAAGSNVNIAAHNFFDPAKGHWSQDYAATAPRKGKFDQAMDQLDELERRAAGST